MTDYVGISKNSRIRIINAKNILLQMEQIRKDMYETLERSEGIGLAAPQVGLPIRLAVINLDVISEDMPEYKGYRHVFINPHILEYDDSETDSMEEGCLSFSVPNICLYKQLFRAPPPSPGPGLWGGSALFIWRGSVSLLLRGWLVWDGCSRGL